MLNRRLERWSTPTEGPVPISVSWRSALSSTSSGNTSRAARAAFAGLPLASKNEGLSRSTASRTTTSSAVARPNTTKVPRQP